MPVVDHMITVRIVAPPPRPAGFKGRAVAGALVGGTLLIVAAAVRIWVGGQNDFYLVAAGGTFVFVVALILSYSYLRRRNATVYVKGGKVGVTNAFGIHAEVSTTDVARLSVVSEHQSGTTNPIEVLVIESKSGPKRIRFRGANRLEPGGIESIAKAIDVPFERH